MTFSKIACGRLLPLVLLMNAWQPRDVEAQVVKSLEVSGGYLYLRDPVSDINFSAGWTAGAAAGVNRWLAGVFQLAGSHKSTDTVVGDVTFDLRSYMAGVRASTRVGPVVEFVHGLVGALHGSAAVLGVRDSSTNLAVQAGGGFDVPVNNMLAFRLEADLRVMPFSGNDPRQFFFTAGLVCKLF